MKGSRTDTGRRWVMHSVWDNRHNLRCGGSTVIAERLYSPSCLEDVFSETHIYDSECVAASTPFTKQWVTLAVWYSSLDIVVLHKVAEELRLCPALFAPGSSATGPDLLNFV